MTPLRSRDFHIYICDNGMSKRTWPPVDPNGPDNIDEGWLETALETALANYGLDIVSLHVNQLKPGDSISVEPSDEES